jgi:catechol 2,3-dioxygenase-like lactoylglutathione lyase family enzyme
VFDHVTIRASDRSASEHFYETVLRAIGLEKTHADEWYPEWNDFSLSQASDDNPATRRLHVAFVAPSRRLVDEFWRVGTEAAYRDDGAPGLRPRYADDYYGAFLLDPDGNSAEAVTFSKPREGDNLIDHLWIRVADVDASRRFYETIGPFAGIRLATVRPERVHFAGANRSFALVRGEPTQNVHLAFPAADNATVEEFHSAATAAGYRDNGPPGERPVYHVGYYGAYVLDPDGNNVEVVNHNR